MQTTPSNFPSAGKKPHWLERPLAAHFTLNWESILFILILVAAVFTRFYQIEPRVMSHDENSHVYYSWLLYRGQGYSHDPVTHGPFQFHIVALSYFLFGDNDTSARIPAVLFSIASVAFLWNYRRYLGRAGALLGALLMLISPYMLYYGRYVRNESFVVLWGLMTLWAILRYIESGQARFLLWLSFAMVMHFDSKETSYIYAAQALLFIGLYFVYRLTQREWPRPGDRGAFLISLISSLALFGLGVVTRILSNRAAAPLDPALGGVSTTPAAATPAVLPAIIFLFVLGGLALLAALFFMVRGHLRPDQAEGRLNQFLIALGSIPLLLGGALVYGMRALQADGAIIGLINEASAQPVPGVEAPGSAGLVVSLILALLPAILIGAGLLFAGYYVMKLPAIIWPQGKERSFDLLIVLGTLMLPLLIAFLVLPIGNPTDYTTTGLIRTASIGIPVICLAIGLGVGWNWRVWVNNVALFYGLFTVFYTTLFTNGLGFFTGLVGSLGYWLEQQGVQRGSQPGYYYALLQMPFYEFLPLIGALLAVILLIIRWSVRRPAVDETFPQEENDGDDRDAPQPAPTMPLLLFWGATSLLAFSIAGEKMPWLTVHITLPFILLAGWFLGQLVEGVQWHKFRQQRGWLAAVLILVFLASLTAVVTPFFSGQKIFAGQDIGSLNTTASFLIGLITAVLTGIGLSMVLKEWSVGQLGRMLALGVFAFLAVATARSAFLASYVNYDRATEFLVYAHCGPGIKEALAQIEEISRRTTGGLDVKIAYDNETTYPYWWYLRNYPNVRYYDRTPTRDLRDYPLILIGSANYSKLEPIVGQGYYSFEYIRIWWPNQDYFDLTWDRIWYAISNPDMRNALFQIWWNRDYTRYAELSSQILGRPIDMSLPHWTPSDTFRLYVRKDVAAQIWNYGVAPSEQEIIADPYEPKKEVLVAENIVGLMGNGEGQFVSPHGIAAAADGSLYVADTGNNRIQHLAADGTVLQVWGTASPGEQDLNNPAPPGTFREPWGVAVGPDGSVYVADTWNHRVQKFTADGKFVTQWGNGIVQDANDPYGFYGPRGIAVDTKGNVYVTDTGNKRVVVFTARGEFITQVGGAGFELGQFDEPVGIAVGPDDTVYVADTWNQRVQSFTTDLSGALVPANNWDIVGWYGQSLSNYPYIAVDEAGHVFITDPEGFRVIEFSGDGKEVVRSWGEGGDGADRFNVNTGITVAPDGSLWVTDSGNNRLMHFILPEK